MTNHIVGKILHEFGTEGTDFKRWGSAECVIPILALS